MEPKTVGVLGILLVSVPFISYGVHLSRNLGEFPPYANTVFWLLPLGIFLYVYGLQRTGRKKLSFFLVITCLAGIGALFGITNFGGTGVLPIDAVVGTVVLIALLVSPFLIPIVGAIEAIRFLRTNS